MQNNNVSIRSVLTEQELKDRIELFNAAIGDRTISRFAKESGLVYTTLKRVIDGETKCSCSYDVLTKIAKYAASNSGVTFEKLLAVNGYNDGRLRDSKQAQGVYYLKEKIEEAYVDASCTVIDDRVSPMAVFEKDIYKKNSDGFTFYVDLYARLGDLNWYIDFEETISRLIKYKIDDTPLQERDVYERALGACILKATLSEEKAKYSFLIDNAKLYEKIGEALSQLRLKNCVSVILCTWNEDYIKSLKETSCLNCEGKKYESIF